MHTLEWMRSVAVHAAVQVELTVHVHLQVHVMCDHRCRSFSIVALMYAMLSSFPFHYLAHLLAPAHMSVILT